MSLPAIYFTTRRFYGKNEALFSTFFLAISYGAISFTSVVFLNSIPLFLGIISSYLVLTGIIDNSNIRLVLSGIIIGLACIVKLSSIVLFLTALAYIILVKKEYKRSIVFIIGYFLIIILFFTIFYSDDMIDQLFKYHFSKPSLDIISKTKLTIISLAVYFPLLTIYGVYSLIDIISDNKRSDADKYYSMTILFLIFFVIIIGYDHFQGSSIYLAQSIYAFAIIAGRGFKKATTQTYVMLVIFFLSTNFIYDITIFTCERPTSIKLMESFNQASYFMTKNTVKNDMLIVTSYIPYYIPLLTDRTIIPDLVDLSKYRLYHDLTESKIISYRKNTRYIIRYKDEYESLEKYERLYVTLGIPINKDNRKFKKIKEKLLLDNTKLVFDNDHIEIYESNVKEQ